MLPHDLNKTSQLKKILSEGEKYASNWYTEPKNIVDLLRAAPSTFSFRERVQNLCLSSELETKIFEQEKQQCQGPPYHFLSKRDEKELASEVLMLRHKFTCYVFENIFFRQAALTIIQNIYLFKQRRIFFGTTDNLYEKERQEALLLFSSSPDKTSIPLSRTFQHLIVARVWDRIINRASETFLKSPAFQELHEVVEKLNTLRNIYMLLTLGLVHKLTRNISTIYRESVTPEDAHQIGSFGIARAAYRYHPSIGQRFSTYASHWVKKEIQRQALDGRLIRVSSSLLEMYSRAEKNGDSKEHNDATRLLTSASPKLMPDSSEVFTSSEQGNQSNPEQIHERREQDVKIVNTIIETLTGKSRDIILRRYGVGPYSGRPQSIMDIANLYGVTRSSIYQMEQTALKKLRNALINYPFYESHTPSDK